MKHKFTGVDHAQLLSNSLSGSILIQFNNIVYSVSFARLSALDKTVDQYLNLIIWFRIAVAYSSHSDRS